MTSTALAILLALAAPDASPSLAALPLLGVWEPTVRGRDAGTILEFCGDGSVSATTGVLLDFDWRRDAEDRIVMVYVERNSGQEIAQPFTVRFEPDGAMVQESGPTVIRFTRAEPARAGDDPVVGLWTDPRFGRTAFTRFTADGRAFLRIAARRDTGFFKVEGDRVTLELRAQPVVTYRFQVEDDALELESLFGEKGSYRRLTEDRR